MEYKFLVYVFVTLLFLAVVFSNFSFAEENRHDCRIRMGTNMSLSRVERVLAMKQCDIVEKSDTSAEEKLLKELGPKLKSAYERAKSILATCEQKYPIYLMVPEKVFYNVVKLPVTATCIKVYNSPYWNYTGSDRLFKIAIYIRNSTLQQLEETKELRIDTLNEARIRQGQIMFLEDLFTKLENKINELERTIEEKNAQIEKNELIIQEQQKTIDDLSKKIKNMVLTSAEIDNVSEKKSIEECLEIVKDKPITFMEKYIELQQCARINLHKPIVIDETKLTDFSKKILEICTQNHQLYLQLSVQDFYNTLSNSASRVCTRLYNDPIWQYEGSDRQQVLMDFIKNKLKELMNDTNNQRESSVYGAYLRSGFLQVMPEVYKIIKQKITTLEEQIAEKNEQIEKQEDTIQKQLKEIEVLSNQVKKTIFKLV